MHKPKSTSTLRISPLPRLSVSLGYLLTNSEEVNFFEREIELIPGISENPGLDGRLSSGVSRAPVELSAPAPLRATDAL